MVLYAAPWSILMSIALYFIMMKVMPPERDAIEGGKELIKHDLNELGPMSAREWRLIVISILLLILVYRKVPPYRFSKCHSNCIRYDVNA